MSRSIKALFAATLCVSAADAHHGFGTFDNRLEVTLTGTLTGVDFVNPHAYVYLDVRGEDGRVAAWRCEMRSATTLRRSGWSKEMFVAGEPITITGARDRYDPQSCYLNTAVFADGTTADRYGQLARPAAPAARGEGRPARLPTGEPNIFGDWAPEQLVMLDASGRGGNLVPLSIAVERAARPADEPDAALQQNFRQYRTREVELTPRGRAAAEGFDTYSTENPRMRCETTSIVFDWTYDGAINRIEKRGDAIVLRYGQFGFTRTIDMNAAEHPADLEPSRGGHSIGRWEGGELVVDTVGFAPGVLSPPVLHGERLHVVERFSLDPAAGTLQRSYVAEDPDYFVGRYEGSDTLQVADLPYSPDPCKELTLFVDDSEQGGQEEAAPARQ